MRRSQIVGIIEVKARGMGHETANAVRVMPHGRLTADCNISRQAGRQTDTQDETDKQLQIHPPTWISIKFPVVELIGLF